MNDDIGPEGAASAAEDVPENRLAPPLPAMRSIMLTGIFVLLVLYTLYVTAEIAIPLTFALLLKLLLLPGMRLLGRLRLPQALSALLLIALLFGLAGGAPICWRGPRRAGRRRRRNACRGSSSA